MSHRTTRRYVILRRAWVSSRPGWTIEFAVLPERPVVVDAPGLLVLGVWSVDATSEPEARGIVAEYLLRRRFNAETGMAVREEFVALVDGGPFDPTKTTVPVGFVIVNHDDDDSFVDGPFPFDVAVRNRTALERLDDETNYWIVVAASAGVVA